MIQEYLVFPANKEPMAIVRAHYFESKDGMVTFSIAHQGVLLERVAAFYQPSSVTKLDKVDETNT